MADTEPRYWRIRLRVADSDDLTKDAWKRDEVGIWYGAWTASDLEDAIAKQPDDIGGYLNNLPSQQELGWGVDIKTVQRFRDISETDWVVVYLRADQEIGLARVCSDLRSTPDHPFNENDNGEIFKYRKINGKKTFKLTRLPDAYRLLPSQGRQGNVHEFRNMWKHVRLLADSQTEQDVNRTVRQMEFHELLGFLGASAWESFCFSYLILEESFVPTGLSIGRTLPLADVVGRRTTDGARIIAQCKKNASPQPIDPDFLGCVNSKDVAYYFAYGGCVGEAPAGIKIITGADALLWATSKLNGELYRRLLLSE